MHTPRLHLSTFWLLAIVTLSLALGTALQPFSLSALSTPTLAPLFRDNAILQHNKPIPVWGAADPGERVTVTFRGYTVTTTTAPDGRWIVYLGPCAPSAQPAELTVTATPPSISGREDGGEGVPQAHTIRLTNILTGDVWLCSGQSNMAWTVKQSQDADQEIAAANNPLIRHITITRRTSDTPLADADTTGWLPATPEHTGNFTAVGYYFARDLQPRLGIPIGIIHSSWGGTPVEAWMSAAALNDNPAFAIVAQRWQKTLDAYHAAKSSAGVPPADEGRLDPRQNSPRDGAGRAMSARETPALPDAPQPRPTQNQKSKIQNPKSRIQNIPGPGHHHTPSGLFNAMIHPLLPNALRGILWYQGEANASRASEYHALFSAMITQWRANFGQGDIPFLWVQLANFKYQNNPDGTDWAFLREAQTKTLSLPATGQAVTIDIGDPDDIHPRNKQEVGRRLALIARAKVHGATVDHTGPVFAAAKREGPAMRVTFFVGADGLTARGRPLQSFELAGPDITFHPATATIDHATNTILVTSPAVSVPVAVRYAWRNSPVANLFNSAGLPAPPFRSDDWPP